MNNMLEVAELVTTSLPDITWQAEARLEKTMTPEFLERVRRGGCRQLMFGFESTSQRVLDLMAKKNRVEIDQRVLAACVEAGIAINLQTFIGLPGETREEAEQTIQYLVENERDIASFGFGVFSLYKDTPIYNEPEKHGATAISIPIQHNLLAACDFVPLSGMSRDEANALHDRALERLTPIYETRSLLLGGAAGAHSLLQFSGREYQELYRSWRSYDEGQVDTSFVERQLDVASDTVCSPMPDGTTHWLFRPETGETWELDALALQLLDRFRAGKRLEEVMAEVGARTESASDPVDRFRVMVRVTAAAHALLRAGVLRVAEGGGHRQVGGAA
jgi:hypothetical protein